MKTLKYKEKNHLKLMFFSRYSFLSKNCCTCIASLRHLVLKFKSLRNENEFQQQNKSFCRKLSYEFFSVFTFFVINFVSKLFKSKHTRINEALRLCTICKWYVIL